MRAFFDESAISPQDGPYMIMAGFVGTEAEFEKASDAWRRCLDESPAIEFFHHRSKECSSKISGLVKVLQDHDLRGFVITIPHSHFDSRDSHAAKGMFGSRIYDWGFVYVVTHVLLWVSRTQPEGEKVHFIFEKRRELDRCIDQLYNPLSKEGEGVWGRAGSCTPEEDKRVAALQMGDLLAGQSLESIRLGRKPDWFLKLEKSRPIFIFNRAPHPVIGRNLILQSIGKKLFDSGWSKILASPKDAVDPAVYETELRLLKLIGALAKQDHGELKKEMGMEDSDD